ncbi:uncharacterized protein LOC119662531 isoform X10 [Teleopsis dalmanni]|uniref:uncharacterized protein LOC119662531 isoform X10 n=1 Tax=Teleopsis dalmanni TaxID=139649 RepID=UPI0018CCB371|nr:uncharacterized protein LOC119662531 isoform X10 [Teleopsis dalmanni]
MDGNAQNMFHGNHQGDSYYRYDAAAAAAAAAAASPRAMGPPGGYPPRHRAPHPLQQQPQYPSYQSTAENIYGLGTPDQHGGMGMGDLSGWGAASTVSAQAGAYAGSGLGAYGHPQAAPPSQQRQSAAQTSYRQHMPTYGQQDQQKLPYTSQQGMMSGLLQQPGPNVGAGGYGALSQQQQQQQQAPTPQQQQSQQGRLPQHYQQASSQHPLYPGAASQSGQPGGPGAVPSGPQAYAHSPYGSPMQHQPGRGAQHVSYGHAGLDQSNAYGQHVPSSGAPGSVSSHHLTAQQQQAAQLGGHPATHMGANPQQQQASAGLQHGGQHVAHPVSSQSSLPPGLSPQQQQQNAHLLQNQQQQQNHVSLMQSTSHQQLPGTGLPPHSMGVPPSYGSHHQQQQQQQAQQQPGVVQSAPPYMSSNKHQTGPQLTSSPQYRAPFPQLSPQMSPRPPTMSPHPQMSPRPGMSPAKPTQQAQAQSQQQVNSPNQQAPHHSITGIVGLTSPRPQPPNAGPPNSKVAGGAGVPPVNTLQALEQMVMPSQGVMSGPSVVPMDYPSPYRQGSHGPMGPRMPVSPQHHQQWGPHINMQQAQQNSNAMGVGGMTGPSQMQQHQQQINLYAQSQSMAHQQQSSQPPTVHPSPIQPPQQQAPQSHQQPPQQQHQLSEQLQHSINDIVSGGQQQQQQSATVQHKQQQQQQTQLASMSPIHQQQTHQQSQQPTMPAMHHMSHHQMTASDNATSATLMSRNTPSHDSPIPTSQPTQPQPQHLTQSQQQQSPLQSQQLQQQSPRHQQPSPHHTHQQQQQQQQQSYNQQQQQQHQMLVDPFSSMLPTQDSSSMQQQQPQQTSTQVTMSPAHVSSPLTLSTSQQQQPQTPSTPSHHLSSILNETANSNDSSTLAVAANDSNNSNNSSSNSSTNSIVNNQPTSVHDSNSQSSINSNHQQQLSGMDSLGHAVLNSNSNSATNTGGILDSAGASLFDNNSMSSTSAAVAAASTAASAAAALLDSNSQSSFIGVNSGNDFECTSKVVMPENIGEESQTHQILLSAADQEDTNGFKSNEGSGLIGDTKSVIDESTTPSRDDHTSLSETTIISDVATDHNKSIDERTMLETDVKVAETLTTGIPQQSQLTPLSTESVSQIQHGQTTQIQTSVNTQQQMPIIPSNASHHGVTATGMTAMGYDNTQQQLTPGVPPMLPPYSSGPGHIYPPYPMLHQQETAALQQQLQELYCMPPGIDHQDKILRLQERLNMLQQHEINDQCAGGPQCMLYQTMPAALYGNSALHNQMVESPQVSSTTGRGRGKGTNKPRKPRAKKGDKGQPTSDLMDISGNVVPTSIPTTQLPVSEDCVTQGAGDTSVVGMLEYHEGNGDLSQDVHSANELDTSTDGTGKKKKPRKPRAPKDPNKPPRDRTPKAKKIKEPADPNSTETTPVPTKKRSAPKKKKTIVEEEIDKGDGSEGEDNKPLICKTDVKATIDKSDDRENKPETTTTDDLSTEPKSGVDIEAPDYDDIPVSKIPTSRSVGDDDKNVEAGDETVDSVPDSAGDVAVTPSRKNKKRSGGRSRASTGGEEESGGKRRRAQLSAKALKKRRNRGRIVPESDGEDDTLASTPPPSPPPDSEMDSNKRRSSRNTQRKKYIDDVMLRFSDDEGSLIGTSPVKKEKKSSASTSFTATAAASSAGSDVEKADGSSANSGGEGEMVATCDEKTIAEGEDGAATEASSSTTNDKEKSVSEQSVPISSKPNYVYINTGDEDSMVVQYVLAVRMGKRELIPDPPPTPKDELKAESESEQIKEQEKSENSEKTEVTETESKENEEEADKVKSETADTDNKIENENEKMECEESEKDAPEKLVQDETEESEVKENEEKMDVDELKVESTETDQKDDKEQNEENSTNETVVDTKDVKKIDVDENIPNNESDDNDNDNKTKTSNDDTNAEESSKEAEKDKDDVNENDIKTEKDKEIESTNKTEKEEANSSNSKPEPIFIDVEEYFVKYRNFSYLHCEWRTEEELFKGDRRVAAKIRRFQQKQAQQMNIFDNIEEEPFNPDFVEVDRVLDMSVHTDETTGETTKHYLVKWKSLPYEDCTWELEEDVDDDKIEQYMRFNKIPPRGEWKNKKRPHPDQWKKLEKTLIYKAGNSLRPYQLEGLNWLKFSWFNSHNCILADEMGLGKTIQSLTFVHSVYEYGIRGPFLVIAPLSTIPNWQREFESWTDMNVVVYHGSVTSKQMIQDYEFYFKTETGKVLKEPVKFNVLITTFEMIVTDHMDLKPFSWRLCVIDEAHRLKNRNCKLLEGLRQLNLEHRVLLSGTPLQNNISELFSLLNFLEPSQFSSAEEFMSEFGSLRTEEEVNKLQVLLKPMMLRRLKDDVEKSLAPKEETIIEVELTNIQKKYYRGILEQNFSFLKKGTTSANIPNLMNTMMELRKCCIHPYLLNGAEEQIQYDYRNQHGEDPESYYKNLIQSAGKMVLIDKLLPKLKANGHRVLIFSQMVRCLDILEDYLVYRKYPFERIDGRIRGNLRQEAIDRYSKPGSDRFVFLLCTKAGGLGINLTAADTVIIYDSDWNPQNDLQAQARCHRIGQRKMVKIYRLLCRNTYEREMFDKASLKLGLDKAVLQSMNTQASKDGSNRQLSKKEIEDLLKKGAYGAVMDDDNAGDKFCEEDIDSILKRRTQIITMESEKGSTFSKASFAASGNRSDITIDDPDFWTKWAKRADIDPDACERDETEDLVLSEPRRRTQIKRYGHEDVMEINSEDSSNENSDEEGGIGLRSRRRKEKRDRGREKKSNDDYVPRERDALAALGLEEIQYGNWAKSECFKVEKGLLSFGWGRWPEILELGQFKRGWRDIDIEDCARIILLYCLQVYKGDEKIKNFIWDLITPTEDGEIQKISRDHSGLHNLVPRGRNGGKAQKESTTSSNSSKVDCEKDSPSQNILDPSHWSKQEKFDADAYLEGAYKKHLSRHANKVLLRVRMLYYIQHEVIGDLVQQIKDNTPVSELPIRPPATPDQVPSSWWNPICCDKSLLVGTYKHGCEMYRQIRADPTLCFVGHVGAGDDLAVTNLPINEDDANSKHEDGDEVDDDGTATKDSDSTKLTAGDNKDSLDPDRPSSSGLDEEESGTGSYPPTNMPIDDATLWPSMQDLNTRLRRVITAYQRNYKKEELKQQQKAKKMERQGKMELAAKERESQRLQSIPKKWNRREEYEFLRVLTGYGVDLQPPTSMGTSLAPDWIKFKQMAHLERKSDETLSDYYKVFIAMCKRQAGVKLHDSERGLEGIIEDITEDHAKLILDRLELLSKLREVARHPQLEERLKLCIMNADTPDWWEAGRHDKELIAAVLKHGLYRSETFIFNDPNFSFAESEKRFIRELEAQIQRTIKLEAFTAENAQALAASTTVNAAPVKNEVIDLDDELLTKDSLIKKEQFSPVKNEPKAEQTTDATIKDTSSEIVDDAPIVEKNKSDLAEKESIDDAVIITKVAEDTTVEQSKDVSVTTKKTSTESTEETITETTPTKSGVEDKANEDTIDKVTEKPELTATQIEKMDTEEAPAASSEKIDKNVAATAVNDVEMKDTTNTETEKVAGTESEEIKNQIDSDKAELSTEKPTVDSVEDTKLVEEKSAASESTLIDKKSDKTVDDANETQTSTDKSAEVQIKDASTPPKRDESTTKEIEIKKENIAILENRSKPEEVVDVAAVTKAVEEECKKQAAELKARFPDLEVIQPAAVKQKYEKPKLEMCMIRWFKDFALERRIAHIVTCVETNKWPVDKTYSAFSGCKGIDLNIGLHEAIPHLNTIERRSTTPDVITITTDQGLTKHLQASQMQQVAGAATAANSTKTSVSNLDASINAAVAAAVAAASGGSSNSLSSLLPGMSMTSTTPGLPGSSSANTSTANVTGNTSKKRKRHIAIDVETERAKLHALLNSSQGMGSKDWETEIANMEAMSAAAVAAAAASTTNSGRRSTSASSPAASSSLSVLQPPPAHQHASLSRQSSGQFNKPAVPPLKTPPPSISAPMDLSSSLPKMNMADMLKSASSAGAIDLSEVQDFSMSKKSSTSSIHAALSSAFPSMSAAACNKSKLDDTLSKLMKKNNCTIEEPVVGKEKKRKKLDEIVLGLSAAKEQKTFPDPSLPSSKKPQIPPSVSVTPAIPSTSISNQNQQNQKPFTITVTTVPGKSKNSASMPSSSSASSTSNSGISALQNMAMGGLSSKDSLNALLAQTMATDPQTFLKQQQKLMQCLPPAQRKAYESMLAEMEQAMKMSTKYNSHDVKVNKWLSDMSSPLNEQLSMDYGAANSSSSSSRRSNRQQSSSSSSQQPTTSQMSKVSSQSGQLHSQHQQQQQSMAGPQGLTGEEPVPVINKQTGKRLTGNKAPQLKRLMPWLTDNPTYEVDPKWLEQMQNPMSAPSPKASAMDSSYTTSSKSHGGRPSSTSSNTSSSSHSQQQQNSSQSSSSSNSSKKSSRQSAIDQANSAMQFGSLAGLNPNLLASLPGLGAFDPKNPLAAFDPKNPLLSMPFAGMPGMGNIPGLGNLNNMNLFASLAGMGGLGNLASMDAQSLAALMAAAGPALSGLGGTTGAGGSSSGSKATAQSSSSSSKKNKSDVSQQSATNSAMGNNVSGSNNSASGSGSSSKNAAAASASQLAAGFPFLFPNPSLLYPPMGLGGLNPYSLGSSGLGSAYDQLAQQYLLNGGATSSTGTSSTTQSKSHQSQSKSSNSRSSSATSSAAANLMNAMASMSNVQNTQPSASTSQSSSRGSRQSAASRAAAQASAEMAQLSNLLMTGPDQLLVESLVRMGGMDLAQATRLINSMGPTPVSSASTSSSANDKRSSSNSIASAAAAAAAAQAAQEKQAAKEQQKWMETLARGALPSDLATLQALSQGKLPSSLTGGASSSQSASTSSSSSKNAAKAAAAAAVAQLPQIPGMPGDISQAFLAEMAAQAVAAAAAGGTLPLTGPVSIASLTNSLAGLTAPLSSTSVASSSGSSSSASKRQREQDAAAKDAFKQQMDYYTKTLGLGSGISLIPTSSASSSISTALDDHHKSKRSRADSHSSQASAKDELAAAALVAGLPLNLGGGMTSIEKSLRSGSATGLSEADKVTLTPLNSAGITANLPSQTTITIAPPISSGASSSSERSERSESRISLTITNAADVAKLPPPYEEADELIIQPILKKPQQTPPANNTAGSSHGGSVEDLEAAANAANSAAAAAAAVVSNATSSPAAVAAAVAAAAAAEENRRSSSRLKRPRSGAEHAISEQPPEKRRELRSTRHTRQSGGNSDVTLNLSTSSEAEDKNE